MLSFLVICSLLQIVVLCGLLSLVSGLNAGVLLPSGEE